MDTIIGGLISPVATVLNPNWISDITNGVKLGNILTVAFGVLRSIFYYLDEVIYTFIINIYNVFRWICGARIGNSEIMNELATRVGFILGLIMFFYISFDFIQILIDPDKMNDKEKGPLNIIKKFIIVIVLLGTSRFIFNLMFNIQTVILSNEDGRGSVIEKLLLPYDIKFDNFGAAISSQFMAQFYQITDDPDVESNDMLDAFDYNECYGFAQRLPDTIVINKSFAIGYNCLNARYKNSEGVIKYYIDFSLWSLPIGIFLVWILIMYCISVGMRVVQIALLEIVSPAAIICYLSPNKENTFTKWLKLYISTYIDVFIRIAIIDFVVLLSGLILDVGFSDNFWTSVPGDVPVGWDRFWIGVLMIMALLSFAKNAPELIKKLLPEKLQSGLSLGFSSKDRAGLGILGGGAVGAVTGVVGGIAGGKGLSRFSGAIGGAVGGAGRGLIAGASGKNLRESLANARKNQAQANLNRAQRIVSGQSWLGSVGDIFRSDLGMIPGGAAADSAAINTLNSYVELQNNIESYADNNPIVKRLLRDYENIQRAGRIGDESDAAFAQRVEEARTRYKDAQHAFIEAAANGQNSFNYTDTSGVAQTANFATDDLNVSNIQAGINERNRIQIENRSLFAEYTVDSVRHGNVAGSTYDQLDDNTNRARSDIARRSATRRREIGK